MASGDLFRAFMVRFSFKKRQHVQMLQKFEDRQLTDGKSKNQVVMDALEMYFDALENNRETKKENGLQKNFWNNGLSSLSRRLRKKYGGNLSVFWLVAGWQGNRLWRFLPMES